MTNSRMLIPLNILSWSVVFTIPSATAEESMTDAIRRDEPYAATWRVTSASKACEGNAENIKPHHSLGATTLVDCMRFCEGNWGCLAVDYYTQTQHCNLYRAACMTPSADHDGASSYRISRNVFWETISTTAACKGSADVLKELGHIPSLKQCKQLCENHAGCLAVDYYQLTQVCHMYEEACITPNFVQDGSQSYMIKRPVNWVQTSATRGCETNTDNVQVHQKLHLPTGGFDLCKKRCERKSDCRAIDYYHATGWCMLYTDACTTPQSTADGVVSWRLLREGLPKPAAVVKVGLLRKESPRAAALPSIWSTIDPDKACQQSGENVQYFKQIQGPEGSTIDDCRQHCENAGRCTAVDYFRATRYCLLYERACVSPVAGHDGASSMRLVRADLAAQQVEFGTAISIGTSSGAGPSQSSDPILRPREAAATSPAAQESSDWRVALRAEFKKIDSEDTGFVPLESLRKAVREGVSAKFGMTDQKLEQILADVAQNGGGLVDYEDFLGFAKTALNA